MSDPSGTTDSTGGTGECQTCNQAPGAPHRLELAADEGQKTLDLVLCEPCASELAAESWIDVRRA